MKKYLLFLVIFSVSSGCHKHITASPNTTPTQKQIQEPAKILYLTFDADMTPKMELELARGQVKAWYSPGLVDFLEQQKIAATIFSTGMFAETYPELLARLSNNTLFSIENHTYDHAAFETPCYGLMGLNSDAAKLEEMSKTQKILQKITKSAPTVLRHPGLCHNKHDDELAANLHLSVSDDGIVSGDAFNRSSDAIVKNVIRQLGASQIIIMHLGGPNAPAIEMAVKKLIPILTGQGYSFSHL